LLLVLIAGCLLVLHPFLDAVLLAIPLCVSTWPLFTRLQGRMGGRRTMAAVVMTVAIALLLVVPLVVLGMNLAEDVAKLNAAACVSRLVCRPNGPLRRCEAIASALYFPFV